MKTIEITDPAQAVALGLIGREVEVYLRNPGVWRKGILEEICIIDDYGDLVPAYFKVGVNYGGKIRVPEITLEDLKVGDVITFREKSIGDSVWQEKTIIINSTNSIYYHKIDVQSGIRRDTKLISRNQKGVPVGVGGDS